MKVLIDVTSTCRSARSSGIQRITRQLFAEFDLVICVSNQSRADLFEFWKQNEVTAGVETFVEHWPLEFDQNERSAAHSARPVILCVSSLTARKNHIRLFDAARQLWDGG